MTIVLVYIDDMLIVGDNLNLNEETKDALQKTFNMKDLGGLRYYLAMELARSKEGILMHQTKHTLEIISESGLGEVNPSMTPMEINVKLTTKEYGDHIFRGTNQAEHIAYQGSYQRLIETMRFGHRLFRVQATFEKG
uniref:Reverse transcriptase Ty1/copia-type domain-containing protein n=1 Tax=Solanum lycopersicum TaxID=4081 RepID=A0A3Q7GH06_SOLLC